MNTSGASPVWRRSGAVLACTAVVAWAAATVPAVAGSAAPSTSHGSWHDQSHDQSHGSSHGGNALHLAGPTLTFQSPLSDLQPTTTQALEGARGTLRMTLGATRSAFVLTVKAVNRSASGTTFGAHLHSGPCVPGDGAAAGPHYNSATPPVVDSSHEVWLDFTVTGFGTGRATAVVPFVPMHGARSLVVHEMGTNHDTGLAGARLACFPVVW